MDRLISEHLLKTRLSTGESRPKKITSELIKDIFIVIDAIPSVDMFSDLKAEISMYENSEQSIDEMIQGIKSIISIYER